MMHALVMSGLAAFHLPNGYLGPCTKVPGTEGIVSTGNPAVFVDNLDANASGDVEAYIRIVGYNPAPPDNDVLVVALDEAAPVYTDIRPIDASLHTSRFHLYYRSLSAGTHVLRVAVLVPHSPWGQSYTKDCFEIKKSS